MDRLISSGYREAITLAQRRMPTNIWRRVRHAGIVCGLDPRFIGLYGESMDVDATTTYFRHLTGDQSTTIVVAPLDDRWVLDNLPYVMAHEYGHVLHETLRWCWSAGAISEYAETNEYEAFAEAFAYHLGFTRKERNGKRVPWKFSPDLATVALFRTLARVTA